jgi:hypothetical protein
MSNSQDVHQNTTRNGYRSAFNRLLAEGDDAVYYLNGSGKLGGPVATDFQAQAGPIAGAGTSFVEALFCTKYRILPRQARDKHTKG